MMKTFQKDGVKKIMKQGQKAGKRKPGANIAYWLPWWNRMEREAEKSRENRISRYLKPIKSTSCPRVACSLDISGNVAKKRHPREETESLQVEFPEGSSSYDKCLGSFSPKPKVPIILI